MEVEANCKAILTDNGYSRAGDWNMQDYRKIEPTHLMSSYVVRYPIWGGGTKTYAPFAAWASGRSLNWYQDYNKAKHDRHTAFEYANLANLTEAIAGLLALLSAQFGGYDYLGRPTTFYDAVDAPKDGFMFALGDYLFVKYPEWPSSERYDFDWDVLKKQADSFQLLQF